MIRSALYGDTDFPRPDRGATAKEHGDYWLAIVELQHTCRDHESAAAAAQIAAAFYARANLRVETPAYAPSLHTEMTWAGARGTQS